MTSQTDLDQGGISRAWVRQYLGPSVGWLYVPGTNAIPVNNPGTLSIALGINLVKVNCMGLVTLILPSAIHSPAGAMAQPSTFADAAITIIDNGGNAGSFPITIQPFSVAETIMGLTQIQITVNYGGYTLAPSSGAKTWNSISP